MPGDNIGATPLASMFASRDYAARKLFLEIAAASGLI